VHRTSRTRHPGPLPGWGPAPGWGQSFPGWSPLVDDGPLPLRIAGSVARWWWPILPLAGFGTVVGIVLGHDDPTTPGLSTRSLATIALAALVVVLLTIHRTAGPGALARAAAEYTVVALLAGLLATGGAVVDQQPTDPPRPSKPNRANAQAAAGDDQPAVLRAVTTVLRAGAAVVRAVTGAGHWLVDLWHRADQQATAKGEAMAAPAPSPTPSARSIWRSHA
jgi:uncharacterized membrane protein YphA (DoxX/SURF4 family)